jgi:serine/threonine-protein kinase
MRCHAPGRGMTDIWQRLRERKLVQWALAYAAGAFALLQGVDIVAGRFGWPEAVERGLIVVLCIGFFVALVLAWYHGERGAQHASGMEIAILALLLALGGGALWRVASTTPASTPGPGAAAGEPAAAVPAPPAAAAPSDAVPIPAKSIAVLPFENLSEEKGNRYFADGMQDLILTKLAEIGDLKVVSRTSTAKYASHPEDLKTIGQQLGVANLLEGSVQKAGNQVLINVQLIDARTDSHVWAQNYQRTLDNIFGVEGEVADKIAQALHARLTPAESAAVAKVGTRNPAALDAYLKGLYYLDDSNRTGDREELERSVPLFRQAIAADPDYADAWAYLSLAYQKLKGYNPEGEAAALRALALDPDNAHAHTMHGYALAGKGEFAAAVAESRKAITLPSHNSSDVAGLGFNLLAAGDIEASSQVFQGAAQADAHLDFAQEWAALTQAMLRNYPAARDGLRKLVAHDPGNANAVSELAQIERIGFGNLDAARKVLQSAATPAGSSATLSQAWYDLEFAARDYPAALAAIAAAPAALFDDKPRALYEGLVYHAQGDAARARPAFATARDQLEAKLKAAPDDSGLHAALASCLAGLGSVDAAMQAARRAVKLQPLQFRALTEPTTLVKLARVEVQVDRTGDAIVSLEQLLSMPAGLDMSVEELRIDPVWDPLRSEPRFAALLTKYANTLSVPVARGHGSD